MRFIFFVLFLTSFKSINSQCDDRYQSSLFSVDKATYQYGQNTTYTGSNQILNLDLYTPQGDTFKKRPCVIFCFGGAFVLGSRTSSELVYFANVLTQLGYVCASIDYRLDDTAHMRTSGENGAVIRAVQDAKAAIRYLKSKSIDYGLDTNQFFIGGTSAGGVTALTVGYSQYNEFSSPIQAKIDSLGGWEGTTNNLTNSSKVKALFNFSGAVLDTTHIQANDLPVYLNHATMDATVPFYSGYPLNGQSSTWMHGSGNIAKRMQSLGNTFTIDSFKTNNHPAFQDLGAILTTGDHLKTFLYSQLNCRMHMAIQSDEKFDFSIPNPIRDFIDVSHLDKREIITIYNQVGTSFLSQKAEDKIDLSHLPNGIFFIQYKGNIQKFIKQN